MFWIKRSSESFAVSVLSTVELKLKGDMISAAQSYRLFENFHIIKRVMGLLLSLYVMVSKEKLIL